MKLALVFLVLVFIFPFNAPEDVKETEKKIEVGSRAVKEAEKNIEGRAVPKFKPFPSPAQRDVWAEKRNADLLKTNSNFRKEIPMNRRKAPTTKRGKKDDIEKTREETQNQKGNSINQGGGDNPERSYPNYYYYCYAFCQNGYCYCVSQYEPDCPYYNQDYPSYYYNYPPYYYDYSPYFYNY